MDRPGSGPRGREGRAGSGEDRVREIFDAALDLPAGERRRYLHVACAGDPTLFQRVQALLAADDDGTPGFLDSVATDALSRVAGAVFGSSRGGFTPPPGFGQLEEIGRGGMGTVYRAWDQTLERTVALKVLHPVLRPGDAGGGEGLLREARAAARLDHPHIAVVHRVGWTDGAAAGRAGGSEPRDGTRQSPARQEGQGCPYLVTAYYDGEPLDRLLARGPLPLARAVRLGRMAAEGLAAAHREGVVHRDVKPSNLMILPGDHLRILDFGLARAGPPRQARESGDSRGPGTPGGAGQLPRAGTPAYMSPQRLRGEDDGEAGDVWSLAAVVVEMVTGITPGRQRHGMNDLLREVDPRLVPTVTDGLREEPAARPTAVEVAARLARLETILGRPEGGLLSMHAGDTSSGGPSLAVLPFTAGPGDEPHSTETAYLATGLAEEILLHLRRVRGLTVTARQSAVRAWSTTPDPGEAGRGLGTEFVLHGGVQRSGDAIRIRLALLEVDTGRERWSRVVEEDRSRLVDVQETVGREIAEALEVELGPADRATLRDYPIRDARAYDAFLRARHHAWTFSADGLARAKRLLGAARELVHDTELIDATLGHVIAMSVEAGVEDDPDAIRRVGGLADRVLAGNPASARGHWLQAFAAFQEGRMGAAIRAARLSLELDGSDPDALLLSGYILCHVGRVPQATARFREALRLDPLNPVARCMPGFAAAMEGRFHEAVEPYRAMVELDPDNPFARVTYGWILASAGSVEAARTMLASAADGFPGSPFAEWAASLAAGLAGRPEQALSAVGPAFRGAAAGSEMFARALAQCCAVAGDADEAMRWLRQAVGLGLWHLDFLERHDPLLAGVRTHPDFAALLAQVRERLAALPPSPG